MLPTVVRKSETGKEGDMENKLYDVTRCDADKGLMSKHIYFGLMALLIVLITAAGFAVGAYFLHHAAKDVKEYHTQFKDENGREVAEYVESDVINDVVKYHIRTGDREGWILNDFGRDITVMKIVDGKGGTDGCYASPLNDKDAADPSDVRDSFDPDAVKQATVLKPTYLTNVEKPIRDRKFLGKRVVEMCAGLDIYWTMPSIDTNVDADTVDKEATPSVSRESRVKRAAKRCYRGRRCIIKRGRGPPVCFNYTYCK